MSAATRSKSRSQFAILDLLKRNERHSGASRDVGIPHSTTCGLTVDRDVEVVAASRSQPGAVDIVAGDWSKINVEHKASVVAAGVRGSSACDALRRVAHGDSIEREFPVDEIERVPTLIAVSTEIEFVHARHNCVDSSAYVQQHIQVFGSFIDTIGIQTVQNGRAVIHHRRLGILAAVVELREQEP